MDLKLFAFVFVVACGFGALLIPFPHVHPGYAVISGKLAVPGQCLIATPVGFTSGECAK
jgi:hypothetical protein